MQYLMPLYPGGSGWDFYLGYQGQTYGGEKGEEAWSCEENS